MPRANGFIAPINTTPDHTYATPHLLLLDAATISEAAIEPQTDEPQPVHDETLLVDLIPITLNVLVSLKRTRSRAMRLLGHIVTLLIRVFVDSRANLKFLNPTIVTRLGLLIDCSHIEPIAVANGRIYYTKRLAYNVSVQLQEYVFSLDIQLLSVLGCDLVLGVEWLESLSYISWHFKNKIITGGHGSLGSLPD